MDEHPVEAEEVSLPQRPVNAELSDNDDREATELAAIGSEGDHEATDEAATAIALHRTKTSSLKRANDNALKRFWRHQISVVVPHDDCRDHLSLERTFLGYLRTSLALSVLGVTIAQLFRLQHSADPSPTLGYFVLAKPLAALFLGAAATVSVVGGWRFWRQQNAIVRGKALAGGWELVTVGLIYLLLTLLLFVLLLAVDINKDL